MSCLAMTGTDARMPVSASRDGTRSGESEIRERARSCMTPAERLAAGAREPIHLFYAERDGTSTVVRVVGLGSGVTRADQLTRRPFRDPYNFLRLALDLDLPS